MNIYCRLILFVTFVALAAIALFPPRSSPDGMKLLPRGFLFSPHLSEANYEEWDKKTSPEGITSWQFHYDAAGIATGRLCCEFMLTIAVAGLLIVPFWSRNRVANVVPTNNEAEK
jgi:hypothetical protein